MKAKVQPIIKRGNIIIDAEGQVLGKLAVQIADLLRGKAKPTFLPNKDAGDFVTIKNVGKMKITGKKMEQKMYYHHTGYLGGLKTTPLKKLFTEDPGEVLKIAVSGMLPKNKLRARFLKRIKFEKVPSLVKSAEDKKE